MRISTVVPLVAASIFGLVPAVLAREQKPLMQAVTVPGSNPLAFCEGHPTSTDILEIDHVNLKPNPPTKGTNLTIEASGSLSEEVTDGAYVLLTVKYGYIKLIDVKGDLCEEIKKVDMECPLGPGPMTFKKEVALPKEIPPGSYVVHADVFNADEKHITCMDATVKFAP